MRNGDRAIQQEEVNKNFISSSVAGSVTPLHTKIAVQLPCKQNHTLLK